MRRASVRLHSELPPTQVWAYEGQVSGPTIEVRSGQPLQVEWLDDLDGELPVAVVTAPNGTQDLPGRGGRDQPP